MPPLYVAGIVIALLAVVLMVFGLPDSFFFALLSLAVLLGAGDQVYREHRSAACGLVVGAFVLAAFAARAAREEHREGRGSYQ
ncbi:hypothetical protein ACIQU5_28055 [Streptomyces sp. NPDC090306]|uniref:hypothetical protein n=1 Tax=Streptomyces sp. NPDC090306 TaxID=3365961 RepID=UPI003821CAF2